MDIKRQIEAPILESSATCPVVNLTGEGKPEKALCCGTRSSPGELMSRWIIQQSENRPGPRLFKSGMGPFGSENMTTSNFSGVIAGAALCRFSSY